ncbi:MAG: hypothetical protein ACLQJR_19470 [Stellaceae bacterium]
MRKELIRMMKELDAAAARLNAGLTAVALVLSLLVGLALTVKLSEAAAPAVPDAAAALIPSP